MAKGYKLVIVTHACTHARFHMYEHTHTIVGLAQARKSKSLAIVMSCCTSAGKPPPHLYIDNQVTVGPGNLG